MRTLLLLALQSKSSADAILNYVFDGKPKERSRDYVKLGGSMFGTRCDIRFNRWVGDVIQRSKLVAMALWCCAPEDEAFALELAQSFPQRAWKEVGGRVAGDTYRKILWAAADEFLAPSFPASMEAEYPDARYYPDADYDEQDGEYRPVEEESRYYAKWHPRREFYCQMYDALLG